MGKHLKSNSCRRSVEKVSISAVTPGPIQAARASFSPTRSRFTKAQLEDQLLRTITSANLSFELTEEPTFRELLDLVYAGPQVLDIPSSKQLRQHMHDMVTTYEESQLQDLPGDSKVSLALCCWKSPLGQDFMAITAYYFDKKWSYREVLLGFELLCRPETGTDERSEDNENSQADTVILESPPTDDLEQDLADKGEDSFLLPPVTWLINSIRGIFSGGAIVT